MKIQAINHFYPTFKSYKYRIDDDEFGIPNYNINDIYENDSYNSNIFEILRNRMYQQANISPDEKIQNNVRSIESLNILNLKKLPANSYMGATLANKDKYIEVAAKNGIDKIIDLHGYHTLKESCNENNIEYLLFPIHKSFWESNIFKSNTQLLNNAIKIANNKKFNENEFKEFADNYIKKINNNRNKFVERFAKLINKVNEGNYYISCQFGDYRTPNILALVSIFDSKWQGELIKPSSPDIYNKAKIMYENLSNENKIALGITPEFEKKIKARLYI